MKYARPPPPPPGGPTVDRFTKQGILESALKRAGFKDVQEQHLTIRGVWPGPPEEAWTAFSEIAAPFRTMIAGLPTAEREKAIAEVVAGLWKHSNGKVVEYPMIVVLGTGAR